MTNERTAPAVELDALGRPPGHYLTEADRGADVLCAWTDRDGDVVEIVQGDPSSTPLVSLKKGADSHSVFIPDDPEPLIAAIREAAAAHVDFKARRPA